MKKRKPKLEPSVGTREKSSRKGKKRNSKSSRDKDKDQSKNHSIQQHEDAALKVAVGFFADELLDQVISDLQQKVESCESLTREDLIPLSLCLLMGGAMPQKERVKSAFDITGKVDGISTEDIAKIEAMVFIMADKFLSQAEMEEIKEGIRVTKLGQMLVELGKEEGKEEEAQRYSRLIISLTNEGKEDVIIKVANDTKLREEMYREYQL